MELKSVDSSRVTHLTHWRREAGQLYLPSVVRQLVERYGFQQFPTFDPKSDNLIFRMGAFEDVGISELGVYQDGISALSRANTDVVKRFLDDVLAWANSHLGMKESGIPPVEWHFESAVIVAMDFAPESAISLLAGLTDRLNGYQSKYGLRPFRFEFAGLIVSPDPTVLTGRNPSPFTLARRADVPFDAGIYHSNAPLRTDDHLALLAAIERELR